MKKQAFLDKWFPNLSPEQASRMVMSGGIGAGLGALTVGGASALQNRKEESEKDRISRIGMNALRGGGLGLAGGAALPFLAPMLYDGPDKQISAVEEAWRNSPQHANLSLAKTFFHGDDDSFSLSNDRLKGGAGIAAVEAAARELYHNSKMQRFGMFRKLKSDIPAYQAVANEAMGQMKIDGADPSRAMRLTLERLRAQDFATQPAHRQMSMLSREGVLRRAKDIARDAIKPVKGKNSKGAPKGPPAVTERAAFRTLLREMENVDPGVVNTKKIERHLRGPVGRIVDRVTGKRPPAGNKLPIDSSVTRFLGRLRGPAVRAPLVYAPILWAADKATNTRINTVTPEALQEFYAAQAAAAQGQ